MKKMVFFSVFFLFFLASLFSNDKGYVKDQLMIQVVGNFQEQEVIEKRLENFLTDFSEFELMIERKLSRRLRIWLVSFNDSNITAKELLSMVKIHVNINEAQFNHKVSLRQNIPDDTHFDNQWSLLNTGQNEGTIGADIDATTAWLATTGGETADGREIVIAVIDNGFDLDHPDMDFWKNENEIPDNGEDSDGNGYVDDYHGWNAHNDTGNIPVQEHGSHVAGIAGAIGNNSEGIAGVNWGVKIMPIAGSSGNEDTVVRAYNYVLDMRSLYNESNGTLGAYVVVTNSSFGVNYGDPDDFPLWGQMYDALGEIGILSAVATANLNIDIDEEGDVPSAFASPYIISVTNTTRNDVRNSGAAFGLTTIDLGAPGTSIISTLPNNNYGNRTGTSMATPHVAGSIAMMHAAIPSVLTELYDSYSEMALSFRQLLLESVDPIADLDGITVTGGRLNLSNIINRFYIYTFPWVEDFADIEEGEIPIDWNANQPSWFVANSSNAGGEPPELLFQSDLTSTDLFRLTLKGIFPREIEKLYLTFRHALETLSGDDYSIRIEISENFIDWQEIWSVTSNENIDSEEVMILLNEFSGFFVLSFVFEGNPSTINYWAIDDISVGEIFFAGGDGSINYPYAISTPEQLNLLRYFYDYNNKYFKLINDIDFSEEFQPEGEFYDEGNGWKPIGTINKSFKGNFDGDGYSINGLYINRPYVDNQGLFGYTSLANISNLNLNNVSVTGFNNVGGLVGRNSALIENCFVSGSVNGNNCVGGISGRNYSSVYNSVSEIEVSGETYVGGLIGMNYQATVQNCHSSGSVLSTGDSTGGLIGYVNNSATINSNSYAIVTGTGDYVGGLVGRNLYDSIIDNCYSNSSVSGNNYTGGLVGISYESEILNSYSLGVVYGDVYVGGLCGDASYSVISKNFSTADITANSRLGGLVGYSYYSSLANNYSTGYVQGGWYSGGLVGTCSNSNVSNCYSIGSVTGSLDVGGLIGNNVSSTVNRSYWNTDTSGQSSSAGGHPRNTNEMTYPHSENTYIEWNFSTVWQADTHNIINNGYPFLEYQSVIWEENFDPHPVDWVLQGNWQFQWEQDYLTFDFYPTVYFFDMSAVSPEITLPQNTGNITINQYYNDYFTFDNEAIEIIIISNEVETVIWHYSTHFGSWGSDGGENLELNLSQFSGENIRIKFRCFGGNTDNIISWNIYNIVIMTDLEETVVIDGFPWVEDFSTTNIGDIPNGWSRSHYDWQVTATNHAGGESPEMRFQTQPSSDQTYRLVSPLIILGDSEQIKVTFNHLLTGSSENEQILSLQISPNGYDWQAVWETLNTTELEAETVETQIFGLNSEEVYLSWVYEGTNTETINWYIDDIYIEELNIINEFPWEEDFSGTEVGEIPDGWTRTHNNWEVWDSDIAGGEAPELKFDSSPSSIDVFRIVTPMINVENVSDLDLSFKHLVAHNDGFYSIKVEISENMDDWETIWLITPQQNIAEELLEIGINNISWDSLYISWVFDGDSSNIHFWFIDDILLVEDLGLLPPLSLSASSGDGFVQLNWETPISLRSDNTNMDNFNQNVKIKNYAKQRTESQTHRNLLGYNIYRDELQINQILVSDTNYIDNNVINGVTYSYFVTAVYSNGESDGSNVVEATPETFVSIEPPYGQGTNQDPYIITSINNLFWIAEDEHRWDKHYLQTVNIDAAVTSGWSEGGWTPIGSFTDYFNNSPFTGSYDGNGLNISNLYINRPNNSYQGLFGYVSEAEINNLHIINTEIFAGSYTGGLVGMAENSTFMNCKSTGVIIANSNVGGLMGSINNSTVNNCRSNYIITGTNTVGGLIGEASTYSNINYSSSDGEVIGHSYVGGLIGVNHYNSNISYSFSVTNVSSTGNFVGGLTGYSDMSILSNNYSTGNVSGNNNVGGLLGDNFNFSTVENCFSIGNITGEDLVGGLVGTNRNNSEVINSYYNTETSGQNDTGKGFPRTTEDMTYPHSTGTFENWSFYEIWEQDELFNINQGYPYLQWQDVEEIMLLPPLNLSATPGNGFVELTWEAPDSRYYRRNIIKHFSEVLKEKSDLSKEDRPTLKETQIAIESRTLVGYNVYRDFLQVNSEPITGLDYTDYDVLNDFNYIYYVTTVYAEGESSWSNLVEAMPVFSEFAGGTGTETDPWQISTTEDLDNIRNYLGYEHNDKYFIQTADLSLDQPPWNSGEGWEPIGSFMERFYGNYNGSGHIITSLFINRPTSSYQGLFGEIMESEVSNLGVINANITGNEHVGLIAGRTETSSTLNNCFGTGIINGSNFVGGLVGSGFSLTITNSYSDISLTATGLYSGGLIGYSCCNSSIANSYSSGNVEGNIYVGGLVGSSWNESTVENSYSTAMTDGNCCVGGLIGDMDELSTVLNCYSKGSVVSSSDNVGGLVGNNWDSTFENVGYSYWDTQTSGLSFSSGGEGKNTADMTYPYDEDTYLNWDFTYIWTSDENYENNYGYPFHLWQTEIPELLPPNNLIAVASNQEVILSWQPPYMFINNNLQYNFSSDIINRSLIGYHVYRDGLMITYDPISETIYTDSDVINGITYTYFVTSVYTSGESQASNTVEVTPEWTEFAGGSGTETDPWLIETDEHFGLIRNYLGDDFSDKYFELVNNIDMSNWNELRNTSNYDNNGWIPIGSDYSNPFKGRLNGNNHTINGLFINRPDHYFQGLFGYIEGAEISNLKVTNVDITGGYYVGALVGESFWYSNITNSYISGSVSGLDNVGGIAGGSGSDSVIANSFSIASVNGDFFVGGLVGTSYYGVFIDSYNRGTVTGNAFVGGLIGFEGSSEISNCYSTGPVNGDIDTGGLIGHSMGSSIENSYWDMQASGQSTSDGGEGRTSEEMTYPYAANTYIDWDFSTIWLSDENYFFNDGYPYHQWYEMSEILLPPVNLSAIFSNGEIVLSWLPPQAAVCSRNVKNEKLFYTNQTNRNLLGYNVYRDDNQINQALITETNFTDYDVQNEITYSYYVTAVYTEGESEPSNVVFITSEFINTAPVVSNVLAFQRSDGSMFVDIFYDVYDADGDELTISLLVSDDDGDTWTVSCELIEAGSDIGDGIYSGNDKHIVWNVGTEHPGVYSNNFKFKVIADDGHEDDEISNNMVFVEGGSFSPAPGYNVTLSSFYINKYEVTQAEYLAVMGENPGSHNSENGEPWDHPVNNVSWFNAIEYCNRLSLLENLTPVYSYDTYGTNPDDWPHGWDEHENHVNLNCDWSSNGYRLPTEMEREFAARGGIPAQDSGTFNDQWAGTDIEAELTDYGWYWDNAAWGLPGGNTHPDYGIHPVGTKLPNELGLYDMSGNVLNWVWDIWWPYPSGSHIDPTGPESGLNRVWRGGSWFSNTDICKVSYRFHLYPTTFNFSTGFRVSRSAN